jgi:hypothetical protein
VFRTPSVFQIDAPRPVNRNLSRRQ